MIMHCVNAYTLKLEIQFSVQNISAVERFTSVWRANVKDVMTLELPVHCKEFEDYYDTAQMKISKLAVLDELVAGMYSVYQCYIL